MESRFREAASSSSPTSTSQIVHLNVGGVHFTTSRHGCQMAVAGFLDRMCLALRASGLWLRYATLQNLIPSFPWIVPPRSPPWHNPRKGRDQILPSGNTGLRPGAALRGNRAGVPSRPGHLRCAGWSNRTGTIKLTAAIYCILPRNKLLCFLEEFMSNFSLSGYNPGPYSAV